MIKLLHTEVTKGCLRLFFLAGKRVLDFTHKALDNEKGLTKMLRLVDNFANINCGVIDNIVVFSCGPDDHVAMVDKLQKSLKLANKVSSLVQIQYSQYSGCIWPILLSILYRG